MVTYNPSFIYFPKGTYIVSDVLWSRVKQGGWSDGWLCGMWYFGESRTETIIKLKDACPGYTDPEKPKAVIKTGSESDKKSNPSGGGNRAFHHRIFNLTVDVGKDNPGAIALDYIAHNNGMVDNVILKSDPSSGYCGLRLERSAGPALVRSLTIEGFDYGVRSSTSIYGMTLEHITISKQKVAGVFNNGHPLWIRDLSSDNSVKAVDIKGEWGHTVLLDCSLSNGAADTTAITNAGGKVFCRNLKTTGYGLAIDDISFKAKQQGPDVSEYASGGALSLFNDAKRSLDIPIEETPFLHLPDPNDWVNVLDFVEEGDNGDHAKAVQRAIDSGKPGVYLPQGTYTFHSTVEIRGEVRKLMGMSAWIRGPGKDKVTDYPLLRLADGKQDVVICEFITFHGDVEFATKRTMVLRCGRGEITSSAAGTGKLFLEDWGAHLDIKSPMKMWARQLNPEFGTTPMIRNQGGTLWIFGMKTELSRDPKHWVQLENRGGVVELLGANFYPLYKGIKGPCIINEDGAVSLSVTFNQAKHPIFARCIKDGEVKELDYSGVPRPGHGPALFVDDLR